MQNTTYSPFVALNDSTVESETVVISAVSSDHSRKNGPIIKKKPLPRIDPDVIILSDSESQSSVGSPIKNDVETFPSSDHETNVGNTSPVLAAVVRKPKKPPPKSDTQSKKLVKKNKALMKVSSSLFQRNSKQAYNEKDASDPQPQIEHLGKTFTPTKESSPTTVKRDPVVILNDVLPNLNKEQLWQLQYHDESPIADLNTDPSQGDTQSSKPMDNSLVKESTGSAAEAPLNSVNPSKLFNNIDSPLGLSPTANVCQDGHMIKRSPGQLPKTHLMSNAKKNFINYGATDGTLLHSSHSHMKSDNSSHVKDSESYKLNQSHDEEKGQVKRSETSVNFSNEIVSKKHFVINTTRLSDKDAILPDNSVHMIESTTANVATTKHAPKSSCDIIANEQHLVLPDIALHTKRKKKKKRRHRSEDKHVSQCGLRVIDLPKLKKKRGRKPATQNVTKNAHFGDSTTNSTAVDLLPTPVEERTKYSVGVIDTQKLKERRGRKPETNNATKNALVGSVRNGVAVNSSLTPAQEHTKSPPNKDSMPSKGVSECTPSLVKDIILDSTNSPSTKAIFESSPEEKTSLTKEVKVSGESPHTEFLATSEKMNSEASGELPLSTFRKTSERKNSEATSSLRPMLERLSPDKRIYTLSPGKSNDSRKSQTGVVTEELEKSTGNKWQDRTVSQTKLPAGSCFKRKSKYAKPGLKVSCKPKPSVKGQKKQKQMKATSARSSDFTKLSPRSKDMQQRKLRKRKPVSYAEDDVTCHPLPKPSKVPKVSKEKRFQHICLKERKDIHEIVIAVEAASHTNSDCSLPRQYNFLFVTTLNELITAFQMSQQNEKCKAVILSSVGPVFCSGLDPVALLTWSPEQPVVQDIIELMTQFVNILIRYSKPIIAIVQGPAVGFGATLLLHCDSVYASDRASLQWPFAQIGLPPFGCTTEMLNQTVGLCRSRSLLLEGRIISAQVAKEFGIITEIFRHESLYANAWPLCSTLRQSPQLALTQAKMLINLNFTKTLVECNGCETSHLKQCLKMPSCLDYLQNYIIHHLLSK